MMHSTNLSMTIRGNFWMRLGRVAEVGDGSELHGVRLRHSSRRTPLELSESFNRSAEDRLCQPRRT